jgi:hypothetical protein
MRRPVLSRTPKSPAVCRLGVAVFFYFDRVEGVVLLDQQIDAFTVF